LLQFNRADIVVVVVVVVIIVVVVVVVVVVSDLIVQAIEVVNNGYFDDVVGQSPKGTDDLINQLSEDGLHTFHS
jgi:predicted PurR-regulated permease PerM